MRGHTKIELTNVSTGEVQVVEHDNMVTNAMNELAKSFHMFETPLQSKWFDSDSCYAQSAFGGLFLFESALNEDPDDFTIPDGNKVIGTGCSLANNSINTMMGSYNTTESGMQEDGSYKHIWDFATDQGNGEISAVALAPKYTGQAGWGMPLELFASSLNLDNVSTRIGNYFRLDRYDFNLFIKDGFLYRIPYEDLYYDSSYSDRHISRNGGKIIIEKLKVMDGSFYIYNCPRNVKIVYETIEYKLPSEFMNSVSKTAKNYYPFAQYDSGYIYIQCDTKSAVNANNSFKMARIKIEDGTSETITIPNATGEQIYHTSGDSSYSYNNTNKRIIVLGNKIMFTGMNSGKKYIVDINNTSSIQIVKQYGTDVEDKTSITTLGWFGNNVICYHYNSNQGYPVMCINMSDCTIRKSNATLGAIGLSGDGSTSQFIPFADDKVHYCGGSDNYYYGFNPFILTTKNNLETSVTKTPAQTMKITYSLIPNEF